MNNKIAIISPFIHFFLKACYVSTTDFYPGIFYWIRIYFFPIFNQSVEYLMVSFTTYTLKV